MGRRVRPTQRVNEKSEVTLTVSYRDADGLAYTPSAVRYRIDCLTNERTVLDWTSVASPSTTNTLTITSAQNAILDDENDEEIRQVIVEVTGSGTPRYDPFVYRLINLHGLT